MDSKQISATHFNLNKVNAKDSELLKEIEQFVESDPSKSLDMIYILLSRGEFSFSLIFSSILLSFFVFDGLKSKQQHVFIQSRRIG